MDKKLQDNLNGPGIFLTNLDLVCFSHLRWHFVYQRPQHLMNKFAAYCRVFFVEEPIFDDNPHLEINEVANNIWIVVPHLRSGLSEYDVALAKKEIFNDLFQEKK